MKKIFIAAATALVVVACESMLEEQVFADISSVEDSDAGADLYAIGAYSYLLDPMLRWDQFPKILEMDCDYATGPDWSLSAIGAGNFAGTDGMDPLWTYGYALIHRTNNAIEQVTKMSGATAAHKENVVGEMEFLKAYIYFLLVRAYGGVPLHKQSVTVDPDFNKPRESVSDVYAYIVELLNSAKDKMYRNTHASFKEGRASAGAAAALLVKVYATMASGAMANGTIMVKGGSTHDGSGDNIKYKQPTQTPFTIQQVAGYENFNVQDYYTKAYNLAQEIVDGTYGNYDLLPYDQLWTIGMRHKVEHIFMLQPVQGDNLYGAGIARYYTGTTDGTEMIVEGCFHGCSNAWYRLFDQEGEQDLRVAQGVMHRWVNRDYHQSWNGGGYYPDDSQWDGPARGIWSSQALGYKLDDDNSTQIAVAKGTIFDDGREYQNNKSSDCIAFLMKYFNVTDRSQVRTDCPYPVLRYADVLLLYAEAANETGNYNKAIDALNKVRSRSRAKAYSGAQDKETLRSAIVEERAKELALESDRRWDIVRFGIYIDVMNAIGADENGIKKSRIRGKHELYPIPAGALSANPNLTQNPNW